MEKQCAVVSGDLVHDIIVRPGTTVHDVMSELSLPKDYCLSRRDGVPFNPNDVIYDAVESGEKLYASAPAIVGL